MEQENKYEELKDEYDEEKRKQTKAPHLDFYGLGWFV